MRLFPICLPFFFPTDDLGPGGEGAGRVTCDFCKCRLAADGEVLGTSSRAKALLKIETRVEQLETELAAAKALVQEREQELAAARAELARRPIGEPAPATVRRGLSFD